MYFVNIMLTIIQYMLMILGNKLLVVICVVWKNDDKVILWFQIHGVLDYNYHILSSDAIMKC